MHVGQKATREVKEICEEVWQCAIHVVVCPPAAHYYSFFKSALVINQSFHQGLRFKKESERGFSIKAAAQQQPSS